MSIIPSITLKYYQAKSEIDGHTGRNTPCEVYYYKESCQKDFPGSVPVLLSGTDVQEPYFLDIPMLATGNKTFAQAFCAESDGSIDTTEREDCIFDDHYILGVRTVPHDIRDFELELMASLTKLCNPLTEGFSLELREFMDAIGPGSTKVAVLWNASENYSQR